MFGFFCAYIASYQPFCRVLREPAMVAIGCGLLGWWSPLRRRGWAEAGAASKLWRRGDDGRVSRMRHGFFFILFV
jgi:hypothetical protein